MATEFQQLVKTILGTGKGVQRDVRTAQWQQDGGFAVWRLTDVAAKLEKFQFKAGPEHFTSAPDGAIGRAIEYAAPYGMKARVIVILGLTPKANRYVVALQAPEMPTEPGPTSVSAPPPVAEPVIVVVRPEPEAAPTTRRARRVSKKAAAEGTAPR